MIGKLYIDGTDAYTAYGVFVAQDGYRGLVCFPALKKIDFNDWPEVDGIEADLSAPVIDAKRFSISFYTTSPNLMGSFLAMLSDGANHTFNFSEINKQVLIRLVSQPGKKKYTYMESFDLEFSEDMPMSGYTYSSPNGNSGQQGYRIDDISLSNYGIFVLDGSGEEILKAPDVKQNLTTNIESKSGQTYDDEIVNYKSKDVKLSLLMRSDSVSQFWNNYNALLYNLIKPEERGLYLDSESLTYKCYYKNANVSRFELISGRVWCEFEITLVFTSYRPSDKVMPSFMEVETTQVLTEGNTDTQKINATLYPGGYTRSVIFIPDSNIITMYSDGSFIINSSGVVNVDVIFTEDPSIRKTITIEIIPPVLMAIESGGLKVLENGGLRLT